MTGPEQTEKARRTKAEKHALNEVLKALQEIVGDELAPETGALRAVPLIPSAQAPEVPELVDEVQGDLWEEDIPVLRHVVAAPEDVPRSGVALSAPAARAIVARAVRTFNARRAEGEALGPPALELLEHLLFEEWVRHATQKRDPGNDQASEDTKA